MDIDDGETSEDEDEKALAWDWAEPLCERTEIIFILKEHWSVAFGNDRCLCFAVHHLHCSLNGRFLSLPIVLMKKNFPMTDDVQYPHTHKHRPVSYELFLLAVTDVWRESKRTVKHIVDDRRALTDWLTKRYIQRWNNRFAVCVVQVNASENITNIRISPSAFLVVDARRARNESNRIDSRWNRARLSKTISSRTYRLNVEDRWHPRNMFHSIRGNTQVEWRKHSHSKHCCVVSHRSTASPWPIYSLHIIMPIRAQWPFRRCRAQLAFTFQHCVDTWR